ncbi:MAG: hypothetical protein ACOY40_05135 [Bacillota bacterium]
MNESSGGNLSASIERLINRMEGLYEQQSVENDRMENMLSLLGRLSEILVRMEEVKNFEAELNKKIDLLNKSLENTVNIQENLLRDQEGMDKTFSRVVDGVKMFGQILSIVAASVQLTVDNIGTVLKNPSQTDNAADKTQVARTQADLASMLQPVSTLVKNLVEEKIKQQEQAVDRDEARMRAGDHGEMS